MDKDRDVILKELFFEIRDYRESVLTLEELVVVVYDIAWQDGYGEGCEAETEHF